MPKTLLGSFEQALRPLPSVVKGVQACRLPALKCLKRSAAASTRHSGHCPLLLRPQMPKKRGSAAPGASPFYCWTMPRACCSTISSLPRQNRSVGELPPNDSASVTVGWRNGCTSIWMCRWVDWMGSRLKYSLPSQSGKNLPSGNLIWQWNTSIKAMFFPPILPGVFMWFPPFRGVSTHINTIFSPKHPQPHRPNLVWVIRFSTHCFPETSSLT